MWCTLSNIYIVCVYVCMDGNDTHTDTRLWEFERLQYSLVSKTEHACVMVAMMHLTNNRFAGVEFHLFAFQTLARLYKQPRRVEQLASSRHVSFALYVVVGMSRVECLPHAPYCTQIAPHSTDPTTNNCKSAATHQLTRR